MGSPLPADPYLALGVSKDATPAVIKSAHRKLVLRCHPDKVSDPAAKEAASDTFHKIQSAYEILIDEDRRGRYDAQVRLAELKREALERRMGGDGPRGSYEPRTSYASQRSSTEQAFREDYRSRGYDAPNYEERRPSFAPAPTAAAPKPTAKQTTAPAPSPAPAPAPAPATATTVAAEFEDSPPRATARKDPELERSSRRSGNDTRERAKAAARDSSKDRQRAAWDERKQRAQRDQRRDRERKYEDRKHSAYVEDESGSASDEYSRRQRRSRDERPADNETELDRARQEYHAKAQRQEKEAATDASLDPIARKMFAQHSKAWEHMAKSRQQRPHADSERRLSPTRGNNSYKEKIEYTMISDARGQQVPVMMRRSSTRPKTDDRDAESSRRRPARDSDRRSPETDAPRRPATFTKSTSSPSDIRLPQSDKLRTQSWDDTGVPTFKPPFPGGIQRAETFNSTYGTSRRVETVFPSKPQGQTPKYEEVSPTSRSYPNYGKQYADDGERPTPDGYRVPGDGVRVETREPETRGRHRTAQYTRHVTHSPDGLTDYREPVRESRPRIDSRYSSSSQAVRSTSYIVNPSGGGVEPLERSRQNSSRSVQSPRVETQPPGPLYGEIPRSRYNGSDAYQNVTYSPTVRPENINTSKIRMSSDRPGMSRGGSYSTVPAVR